MSIGPLSMAGAVESLPERRAMSNDWTVASKCTASLARRLFKRHRNGTMIGAHNLGVVGGGLQASRGLVVDQKVIDTPADIPGPGVGDARTERVVSAAGIEFAE